MASSYNETNLKKKEQAQQTSAGAETDLSKMLGVSDTTKQNLATYQGGYKQSDAVTAAQETLNAANAAKPQAYTSQYDAQIADIYNKIMARGDFSYDLNGDMLYQQYKDQHQQMGKNAMQDAMGQAAGLTGGYGNSWAATAGNQAYQGYLQQLNSKVPELYALAYDKYNQEGQELMDQYKMAASAEESAYGRWQDQYNAWLNEQQMAQNAYDTERNLDYSQYQDNLNYWTSIANQENANYWQGRDQAYQTALAMLQNGQLPNDEMLYAAGLTAEDAETLKALYAQQKGSSGSSGGGSKGKLPTEAMYQTFRDIYASEGASAADDYLEAMAASGYNGDALASWGAQRLGWSSDEAAKSSSAFASVAGYVAALQESLKKQEEKKLNGKVVISK